MTSLGEDVKVYAKKKTADEHPYTAANEKLALTNGTDEENRDKGCCHLHHTHCKEGDKVCFVRFISSVFEDLRRVKYGHVDAAELLEEHKKQN